jgi:hypothetical protein
MNAADILDQARALGVRIAPEGEDGLYVRGPRSPIHQLAPILREHEPELLAALKEAENNLATFEERAAIIEFDGGPRRAEAEHLAWEQVQALMQRLSALEWLAHHSPERLPQGYRPEHFPVAKLRPGPEFWEERERRGRSA